MVILRAVNLRLQFVGAFRHQTGGWWEDAGWRSVVFYLPLGRRRPYLPVLADRCRRRLGDGTVHSSSLLICFSVVVSFVAACLVVFSSSLLLVSG